MAYLGKTPSQATRSRFYFTATGGETSLSGADDNGNTLVFSDGNYVDVMLNGVTLVADTDYDTDTANTIDNLTALTADDVVEIVVYDTFSVFGGDVKGDFNVQNGTLTAETVTASGLVTAQDGLVVDNDGATVATFDRATDDGTIVDLQKDGSAVGSIGSVAGGSGTIPYITSNQSGTLNVGLRFDADPNQIQPCQANGADRDAGVSLGGADDRFKDLYLSGGVYLGGTGSANKLDDYEEGTFTPTLPSGGAISSTAGSVYTRIGNTVHFQVYIQYSGVPNNSSTFEIGGMPYQADTSGGKQIHGNAVLTYVNNVDATNFGSGLVDTSSEIYWHRKNNAATLKNSDFTGSTQIILAGTYTAP